MRFASARQTEARGLENREPSERRKKFNHKWAHLGKDGSVCFFIPSSFLIMFFFSFLHLNDPTYFSHYTSSFSAHWCLSTRCLDPLVHLQSVQLSVLGSLNMLRLPHSWASLLVQSVKNLPEMLETMNVIRMVSTLPGLPSPSSSRANKNLRSSCLSFSSIPIKCSIFPREVIRSAHHGFPRSSSIWSCFQEPNFCSLLISVILAQQRPNHQRVCQKFCILGPIPDKASQNLHFKKTNKWLRCILKFEKCC